MEDMTNHCSNFVKHHKNFDLHVYSEFLKNLNLRIFCLPAKGNKWQASYVFSYETASYPLYKPNWVLFVSVHANTIPAV